MRGKQMMQKGKKWQSTAFRLYVHKRFYFFPMFSFSFSTQIQTKVGNMLHHCNYMRLMIHEMMKNNNNGNNGKNNLILIFVMLIFFAFRCNDTLVRF
jgi:hypothetical protein